MEHNRIENTKGETGKHNAQRTKCNTSGNCSNQFKGLMNDGREGVGKEKDEKENLNENDLKQVQKDLSYVNHKSTEIQFKDNINDSEINHDHKLICNPNQKDVVLSNNFMTKQNQNLVISKNTKINSDIINQNVINKQKHF